MLSFNLKIQATLGEETINYAKYRTGNDFDIVAGNFESLFDSLSDIGDPETYKKFGDNGDEYEEDGDYDEANDDYDEEDGDYNEAGDDYDEEDGDYKDDKEDYGDGGDYEEGEYEDNEEDYGGGGDYEDDGDDGDYEESGDYGDGGYGDDDKDGDGLANCTLDNPGRAENGSSANDEGEERTWDNCDEYLSESALMEAMPEPVGIAGLTGASTSIFSVPLRKRHFSFSFHQISS